MDEWKDKIIQSRDGKREGHTTGSTQRCQLEGCTGLRVSVTWGNGSRTYPCTKGLIHVRDNIFRID